MPKPTKAEVTRYVLHQISQLSGLAEIDFLRTDVLAKQPLYFDSIGLANLALTIRGYLQQKEAAKTLLVTEVRKPGLTVSGLIELVYAKFS